MNFPENILYSKEHIWLLVEGQTGTIGITDFAQSELGEIVYVELPNIGQSFKADEIFGSVEAVKTTSDLFMPVSGKVTEINTTLTKKPELVNTDPFDKGWMIKIELSDLPETERLLSADPYKELVIYHLDPTITEIRQTKSCQHGNKSLEGLYLEMIE